MKSKHGKDFVRNLLKIVNERFPPDLPVSAEPFNNLLWTNNAWWLGETSFLTMIPYMAAKNGKQMYIRSESFWFDKLMTFNDYYIPGPTDMGLYTPIHYIVRYNFGPGHFLQILQRGMGFEAELKPATYFNIPAEKVKNSVLISIEGDHYGHLTVQVRDQIQEFVNRNKNEFKFTETWARSEKANLITDNYIHTDIISLIKQMASFEYFVGFDSGLMNVASGLGMKGIIIVDGSNGLKVEMLYLPRPNDSEKMLGSDFLYPQHVHLYMNDENELVPRFDVENLERAMGGDVYPYWSDEYLDLILEFK